MRAFVILWVASFCAAAQSISNNRLTLSAGWSHQVGGLSFEDKLSAPGLGLSYGYRVHRYLEPEIGLFTALDPTGSVCDHSGCVDIDDHFFWIPFGARFVAPLYLGRIEFSGGGGGLFEKYTVGNQFGGGAPEARQAWGGYFVASASVALDHSRHFWIGFTPRLFLANANNNRDRWLQLNGDISFRFR